MRSAKGRAASAAVCARRSFAAATICMALVIFCVAFTEAMRLRRSLRLGIERSYPALRKRLGEGLDGALQLGPVVVREVARGADVLQDLRVTAAHVAEQALLEGTHAVDGQRIEIAVDAGVDDNDLLLHLERRELRLLEELGEARAAVEEALRGGVEVRAELREGGHLAILRQLALDAPGNLLHRLRLGRGADARHRKADVHGRADALIEQIGLEEDLAVGDRDH